jgi:hypothetical protein
MLYGGSPNSVRWNQSPGNALPVLITLGVLTTGCSSEKQDRKSDPPLLVPWSRIGDIWLGERRADVERIYGIEGRGFHVVQRYGGGRDRAVQGYYRLHGSQVLVTFYGNHVGQIGFETPYYRTKDGFGVGRRIRLGPCHRSRSLATHPCEHRWRGFVFNAWSHDEPCGCWTKVGTGRRSLPATVANFVKPWFIIYVDRGHVTGFYFDLKYVD